MSENLTITININKNIAEALKTGYDDYLKKGWWKFCFICWRI